MRRRTRLALDEMKRAALLDDEVDLDPARLAVVLHVRLPASMQQPFEDLTGHPAFEQRAAKGVSAQLIGIPDPEETACDAGIDEVKLRRFDDLLPDISMPRRNEGGDETRLQETQPRPRRIVRDAGISAEGRRG